MTRWGLLGLYVVWLACVGFADWMSPAGLGPKMFGLGGEPRGYVELLVVGLVLAGAISMPASVVEKIFRAALWLICVVALSWWISVRSRLDWPFEADEMGVVGALAVVYAAARREWALAPVGLLVIALAGARGPLVGLVLGLGAVAGWRYALAGGLAGAMLLLPRLTTTDSLMVRLGLWRRAWEQGIWWKPYGWGNSGWTWVEFSSDGTRLVVDVNDRAHQIGLDWILVGGFGGAMAIGGIWGLAAVGPSRLGRALVLTYLGGMFVLYDMTWGSLVLGLAARLHLEESEMARLNDTEALASKPIVGGKTSNPDVSGFAPRSTHDRLNRPMSGPYEAAPDSGKPLRGAVSYLNQTACKP